MYCQKCGKIIDEDSVFCGFCGAAVEYSPPTTEYSEEADFSSEETLSNEENYSAETDYSGDAFNQNKVSHMTEPRIPYEDRDLRANQETGNARGWTETVRNVKEWAQMERDSEEGHRCKFCGAIIPEDSRFCPECRSPQVDTAIKDASKRISSYISGDSDNATARRNKKIVMFFAGAIGFCILLSIFSSLYKPRANLNKYVDVVFDGYDKVGTATLVFDDDAFSDKIGSKLGNNSINGGSGDYDDVKTAGFLGECVEVSLDKTEGLKNGDVVKLKWKCKDSVALKKYGVKLKYKDEEYEVKGLQEAETADIFQGIIVNYSGLSGEGRAELEVETPNQFTNKLYYNLDKSYDLKNGDTVTVTAAVSDWGNTDLINYCLENYGVVPQETTKTYTVDGLGEYVSSIDQISKDELKKMQDQASDIYTAYVAKNWGSNENLASFKYVGDYLLTAKEGAYGNKNILYLVYKVEAHDFYSGEAGTYDNNNAFYWYVAFNNILVDPSGNITFNMSDYDTAREQVNFDSGIRDGWNDVAWRYYGYESIDALYKSVVTSNMESYNHEDNI